jgi:hypothetical protein
MAQAVRAGPLLGGAVAAQAPPARVMRLGAPGRDKACDLLSVWRFADNPPEHWPNRADERVAERVELLRNARALAGRGA